MHLPHTGGGVHTGSHAESNAGTADHRSTGEKIKEAGEQLKGWFAVAHGMGEKSRGEFGARVDRMADEVSRSLVSHMLKKGFRSEGGRTWDLETILILRWRDCARVYIKWWKEELERKT